MKTYPGDPAGQRIGEVLFQDYAEKGEYPNPGMGVWFWQTMFDAAILGVEGAIRKHRPEWRTVLGLPPVTMAPITLPALTVDGARFRTTTGLPWQWRGSTDFLLYLRYLRGEDLQPLLQQRARVGCTLVRVLGMVNSFAHLWPQEHPDFYSRLPDFAKLLAGAGLYLEFVVFADAQIIMPDVATQRAHFGTVCDVLAPQPNILIELGNEFGDQSRGDYGKNGFNPGNFSKPTGLLSSRGSSVGGVPPYRPPWDYSTFHEDRSFPAWVKDANMIEIQNGYTEYPGGVGFAHPIVEDEPIKMGTGEILDRSLIDQFAGIAGASSAGATFHSRQGVTSDLWDADTLACAETFYRALSGGAE